MKASAQAKINGLIDHELEEECPMEDQELRKLAEEVGVLFIEPELKEQLEEQLKKQLVEQLEKQWFAWGDMISEINARRWQVRQSAS
ncbi:hypothetical protein ACFL29_01130 [Patescibacteria group bacterium]